MTPPAAPNSPKPDRRRPLIVVLTGGIASGKTAVSDAFAALGVPVVDTDLLAREVVAPGSPGLDEVFVVFGNDVRAADGSLDRSALRRRIFSDPAARRQLEAILHPRIAALAEQHLERIEEPYAILVVPLLVETGLIRHRDRVLVVDVPESTQIERLMRRDGGDRSAAEAALAAQASRQQRLAIADDVLDNTGSLEALRARVAEPDDDYRRRAGGLSAAAPDG